MEVLAKRMALLVSLIIVTGCTGEILEDLESSSATSQFCPFSRHTDGSCPSPSGDSSNPPFVVDQLDNDNSLRGFGGGTKVGTTYTGGVLTLSSTTNRAELNQSWTPQWNSLVAYLKLDNNCVNEINSATNCSFVNSPSFESVSKIGTHSVLFNSNGEYVTLPDHASFDITDRLTVSMWIYPLSYINWQRYAEKRAANQSWYFGGRNSQENSVCLIINDTQVACDNTREFGLNQWTHILFTYDKDAGGTDEVKIYINGALRKTGDYSTPIGTNNEAISLGANKAITTERFNGHIDDFAMWNAALTKEEVQQIYQRQSAKFTGSFTSRVIDSGNVTSAWTHIKWITDLPYGKELPSNGIHEEVSNYAGLASPPLPHSNLLDSIIAVWHLNEATANSAPGGLDAKDDSGNNNHSTESGTITYNIESPFRTGFNFANGHLEAGDIGDFPNNDPYTISLWFRTSFGDTNTYPGLLCKLETATAGDGWCFAMVAEQGNVYFVRRGLGNVNNHAFGPSLNYNDGLWHHAVITYDGSTMTMFVDAIAGTPVASSNTLPNSTRTLVIGSFGTGGLNFQGELDEIAMWSRALSASEVLQLYQRGANRLKYQVRSCSSPNCNDQNILSGEGWKGPGGDGKTFFSELFNNSSVSSSCMISQACNPLEITHNGNVLSPSPNIDMTSFGADGITIDNNRFFQYRVIMESDDQNGACSAGATCLPRINSVEIGPER